MARTEKDFKTDEENSFFHFQLLILHHCKCASTGFPLFIGQESNQLSHVKQRVQGLSLETAE